MACKHKRYFEEYERVPGRRYRVHRVCEDCHETMALFFRTGEPVFRKSHFIVNKKGKHERVEQDAQLGTPTGPGKGGGDLKGQQGGKAGGKPDLKSDGEVQKEVEEAVKAVKDQIKQALRGESEKAKVEAQSKAEAKAEDAEVERRVKEERFDACPDDDRQCGSCRRIREEKREEVQKERRESKKERQEREKKEWREKGLRRLLRASDDWNEVFRAQYGEKVDEPQRERVARRLGAAGLTEV